MVLEICLQKDWRVKTSEAKDSSPLMVVECLCFSTDADRTANYNSESVVTGSNQIPIACAEKGRFGNAKIIWMSFCWPLHKNQHTVQQAWFDSQTNQSHFHSSYEHQLHRC